MCGIVGVADASGSNRLNVDVVRAMADRIIHRGPDDEGFHDGGNAILGMRRLSIIDLAHGHQPISNEDGSIWVVCNGEIYNFRRLRKELEALGHRFRSHSDTEVLVHLYEEYGEDLVNHIEGMFGFALWDAVRGKLLIARDRLGIKPVYFIRSGRCVAFSSEVKAFLALPGFSADVDMHALSDYLAIGYSVAPRTMFSGVSKLSPGTLLVWCEGEVEVRRYWSPPENVDAVPDADEWVQQIRAELERSIANHMVSDVPLGAFLSGGVDSSAVAILMARHTEGPLNTYSIGYQGDRGLSHYNELPYARVVAEQLGSCHREIEVEPNVAHLLPKLIWHLEEPICDSAMATTYLVSELARDSVTVILSGVGGDELFAGYNRYLSGHYSRRYNRLPVWARQRLMPVLARLLPSGRQNKFMDVARYAKRFIRANQLGWREQYWLYLSMADHAVLEALQTTAGHREQDGLMRILTGEDSSDELLRLLRVDLQTQLSEDLLLLTDKMTMACSLECRVPFLDHRLVELAAAIPARHKLPGGQLKGLLKRALRGVLPDEVIDRRKRGFGAPVGVWFKRELAGIRRSLLNRKVIARRGYIDPDVVEAVCAAHDSNREDYTDLILVLLNLEIWSRLYLDGRSYEDVSSELSDEAMAV